MRNTFMFPNQQSKKREGDMVFCSEQLGCWKFVINQNTRQKEGAETSSHGQSKQVGQTVEGVLPH